jgi:hypothetical protein
MRHDLMFYLSDLLPMRPACFSNLLVSPGFPLLVIFLGRQERASRCFNSGLVLLLTAKHPAEPTHGLGFEVFPSGCYKGDRKPTKI